MSLLGMLKPTGPSGYGYGSTAEQVTAGLDLTGKTYLLTGCNSGIGNETLRVLGLRGGSVIAAARTIEKAQSALTAASADGVPVACDLSDLVSVRRCVEQVKGLGGSLDAIICNAGIMALPKLRQSHGYELQFFTNHIGHFILVTELTEMSSESGRVVMVSSSAHSAAPRGGIQFDNLSGDTGYAPWRNYGQSKLANILFAKQLATRLSGTGRTANALHPGVIQTGLQRHMGPVAMAGMSAVGGLFLKSVGEGRDRGWASL